jgi:hypothetical protein
LKAKIYQTALGGAPQTSKSGNRTNALTGVTGLTNDEKLLFPPSSFDGNGFGLGLGSHSRAGAASVLNIHSAMSGGNGPLCTYQTVPDFEEFINASDMQSLVEFRRREDALSHSLYDS